MKIIITGASRGLGAELVRQFAANKNNEIVALATNKQKLFELKEYCLNTYENDIHVHTLNFLSSNLKGELDSLFLNHSHHYDLIINNAGLLINESFEKTTLQNIQEIYQVNLFGPIQVIQSLMPSLDKNKICHIVNIGSMGGVQGSVKFPGLSIYSSSKAALANLTECLAEEFKETNIKVNCLALGSVQTDMLNEAFPGFIAQTSVEEMAKFIVQFSTQNPICFNGKVISVSSSTP